MAHSSTPAPNSAARAPGAGRRFELLTLGDELLLGLTPNGHLTWIGQQLGRHGVQLARNATVTDEAAAIAAELRGSWARADVVITTGGLGPTCDDRTREAVAAVIGQQLVFDPAIEQAIADRFVRLGRKMTANNLKQAYRFERGEVLPNSNGTAPGLWVEQDGKVLVMLPGPPNELQPLFTEQVLPRLAKLGLISEGEAYVQLRTAGVGESALEMKLQPIFDGAGPALSVAYCAHQWRVDVRLSSPGGGLAMPELQAIAAECAALLGEDFVCYGHDSLAKVVADLFRAQDKTVAVAESCTGGLLANLFTDVCGASKFFRGAIVCYSNDAKTQILDVPECLITQHGAVSAECAVALATSVAETMEADYGLAITGYAGPTGGTQDNPIGTVYLGLHSPQGVWSKNLHYAGLRTTVKERAVTVALDWLRRELVRVAHKRTVPARRATLIG
ncbi:MAG TPA: competence/damage-inducible protein A [Opitutaceae bacterium]|nr:competence/damage-inducible protein A [Opitutaceae bacterium]